MLYNVRAQRKLLFVLLLSLLAVLIVDTAWLPDLFVAPPACSRLMSLVFDSGGVVFNKIKYMIIGIYNNSKTNNKMFVR